MDVFTDEFFMNEAFKQAKIALEEGEVPVGAVIVSKNRIIAKGYNQTERLTDVTAHAEMIAITSAANHLGAKYLIDCRLYVTLEPCVMCAGALFWTQIGTIHFGASDLKRGFQSTAPGALHAKTKVFGGLMAKESETLLQEFFKKLRN